MSARGEGTKTALIESQAKLRLSEAQVIESKQELINAHNALFAMLGKEVGTLDRLSDNFNLLPLESVDLEAWKTQALQNNPEIAAQKEAVEVAKQEVKRNQAGHMPRLDAVASISQSDSDSVPTFQQELDTKSIGLQLNIPIYAGGSVTALTAQSQANYLKTQAELDSKVNEVLLDLRKQHSNLKSGMLKIEALQQSVTAADLLITASKKSLIGGVRTNLDVLNARTQLFEAKRDLSLARYNYIISYVNLRKSAGILTSADLEKIATYFVSQPRVLVEEDANYAMSN
jgi:protease secretion system outer membrane protein